MPISCLLGLYISLRKLTINGTPEHFLSADSTTEACFASLAKVDDRYHVTMSVGVSDLKS
jgi:hypothetical protein